MDTDIFITMNFSQQKFYFRFFPPFRVLALNISKHHLKVLLKIENLA